MMIGALSPFAIWVAWVSRDRRTKEQRAADFAKSLSPVRRANEIPGYSGPYAQEPPRKEYPATRK